MENAICKYIPRAHNQLDPRLCAFHMCKRICAFLLCASGYVRTICAFNMCEPYVRLICAFFTNSMFDDFPLAPQGAPGDPPGSLQEAPREPPRAPGESTYQRHMCLLPWGAASGGLPWASSGGLPWASSGGLPAKPARRIRKNVTKM